MYLLHFMMMFVYFTKMTLTVSPQLKLASNFLRYDR